VLRAYVCVFELHAGLESESFQHTEDGVANEMGLFLQKTNIIRDYLVRLGA
jgi:phytoene/squalene synthetase